MRKFLRAGLLLPFCELCLRPCGLAWQAPRKAPAGSAMGGAARAEHERTRRKHDEKSNKDLYACMHRGRQARPRAHGRSDWRRRRARGEARDGARGAADKSDHTSRGPRDWSSDGDDRSPSGCALLLRQHVHAPRRIRAQRRCVNRARPPPWHALPASIRHGQYMTVYSTFLRKLHPSVSRALPPVGWHSTVEQPLQMTTVCAWLNTVVLRSEEARGTNRVSSG